MYWIYYKLLKILIELEFAQHHQLPNSTTKKIRTWCLHKILINSTEANSKKRSMTKKDSLITKYNMQPHPEGGFYVETFRSSTSVDTEKGPRSASTAIYFLMCDGNISRLHRIVSDEVWHFYAGTSITVVELDESTGDCKKTILGSNVTSDDSKECMQYVVKGGTWFGSFPNIKEGNEEAYSLVGCTVSPGFDFSDFELGSNALLTKQFPKAAASGVIDKMTVGLPWIHTYIYLSK